MRVRSLVWAAAMVCAMTSLFSPVHANIVQNGDFEVPDIGLSLFLPVFPGETTINDWGVQAPSGSQGVDIVSTRTGMPQFAHNGQQAIDLSGSPGRGAIFQDLPTNPGWHLQFKLLRIYKFRPIQQWFVN